MKNETITCTSCGEIVECAAHKYVMELLANNREDYKAISEASIKLTANMEELRRLNERMDTIIVELREKNEKQDEKISTNRDYVMKTLGVVGSVSFIAFLGSAITAIVTFFVDK